MIINDEIPVKYFNKVEPKKYSEHWIFHNIQKGECLFEPPTYEDEMLVKEVYEKIKYSLNQFEPMNEKLFKKLFPEYNKILDKTDVMLVVGCPNPYDAMVRTYNNRQYVVFDLIRLTEYFKSGYKLDKLINQLLTHEFAHKCLAEDYKFNENLTYNEELNYITFDEGFAHLLAYKDNIESYNFFTSDYMDKYKSAKKMLEKAVNEKDLDKQKEFLYKANAGDYWEKFASISGKLYLGSNIEPILNIYKKGWQNIIYDILQK